MDGSRSQHAFPQGDTASSGPQAVSVEAAANGSASFPRERSIGIVVGAALVGALAGGLLMAQSRYTATALVQAAPVDLGGVNLGDAAMRYVREELVRATTDEEKLVADAAAATGADPATRVTITERSGTTFLAFQAIAGGAEEAAAMANASAKIYIDGWLARTVAGLEQSLDILDGQLAQTPEGSPGASQLEARRTEVRTELASVEAAERMVSPAAADAATTSSSLIGGVLLGALVGLTAGLLALILVRRRGTARTSEGP